MVVSLPMRMETPTKAAPVKEQPVVSLPMRNGNYFYRIGAGTHYTVVSLPMRDGNITNGFGAITSMFLLAYL